MFANNLVRPGLFFAFDIHDMNFDFCHTSNSDLKELKYETLTQFLKGCSCHPPESLNPGFFLGI